MEVFLNENSLHAQYHSIPEFKEALLLIIESLNSLNIIDKNIFRSTSLFNMQITNGVTLAGLLKNNSDMSYRFKDALQKNNIKIWDVSKQHLDHILYEYSGQNYNGFSIAELAEKKHQNAENQSFLLNFFPSNFIGLTTIEIVRDKVSTIEIDLAHDSKSISDWLISKNLIVKIKPYDENSRVPPTDIQTVLIDSKIFEKTSYPNNNRRRVYKRIGTNELWSVDGTVRHATAKAHIEVFDEITRKHLGTSLYNVVEVDKSEAKPGRYINLG